MTYVPLRVHSDFSLLSATIRPKQLVDYAIENNLPAIALTDHNNLFAAPEFCFYAQAKGYPAILGTSLTTDQGELMLYCKDQIGYSNLCRILSDFYSRFKGVFPLKELRGLTDGLLALSGGVDGVIASNGENNCKLLLELFEDNFALELNRTNGKHSSEDLIAKLSAKHNVPVIGTSVAHFIKNSVAYQVIKAIGAGEVLVFDNKDIDNSHKMLSADEFRERFADSPQVIENTLKFAEKTAFLLEKTKPRFAIFADESEALLKLWALEGLEYLISKQTWKLAVKERFASEEEAKAHYLNRLNSELDMIIKLGFTHYFLIVADFVKWARKQEISLSARGSGGGSLVAWALFITVLDPIQFGLIFERFLNPGRVSLPDFDIDFCQERRGEVIEYVQHKYGSDKIAHIITFGALHARGVLRDVGRVLGLPYKLIDGMCRRVPSGPNISVTLKEVLDSDEELKKMCKDDQRIARLFDIALDLEGVHRNISIHAAGIVIGDAPLRELIPLYQNEDMNIPATQYVMKYVEDAGFVKFDFLGLTALTIIDKVLAELRKQNIEIDINHIIHTDQEVFKLVNQGLTAGVFQFETAGLTDVVLKLQPTELEDWIAVISLFRPGPLQNIPEFIARKHGINPITYEYDELEPILKNTYGIIVYQEQVIAIARDLAGYSLSEADLLRRAMGKKDPKEMKRNRDIFVKRFVERQGGDVERAAALFDSIEKFSGYAFNKSHAACYAFIAYQNAFLKTYYPIQFMAVSMTMEKQKHEKISGLAAEFQALNLQLLHPDVNFSTDVFETEDEKRVRYCLSAIKGVGDAFAKQLMQARTRTLVSVEDFCFVCRPSKKILEALILSGALDALPAYEHEKPSNMHHHRNYLWGIKEQLLEGAGQSIFEQEWKEEFSMTKLLVREYKAMGVILSARELGKIMHIDENIMLSGDVKKNLVEHEHRLFVTQGIVVNKDLIKTRSGTTQWAVKLVDQQGLYEVFVRNETEARINIQEGMVLKVQSKQVRTFWIAEQIFKQEHQPKILNIEILEEQTLEKLHKLFKTIPFGEVEVVLMLDDKRLSIGDFAVNNKIFEALDLLQVRYRMG